MDVITDDSIRLIVNNKEVINFGSMNYLGIAQEESIINAGIEALKKYGVLGKYPAYFSGRHEFYVDAEEKAKEFFKSDTLYISVGYMLGLIAVQGLSDKFDAAFIDEHCHYNLFDGIRSVNKPYYTFKHLDAGNLEAVIKKHLPEGRIPLIITDGVFPTYGDVAPLDIYKEIADRNNGWMLIDESHAFGVLGGGRGSACHYKITGDRVVFGGSATKGFSSFGGLIAAPSDIIQSMKRTGAAIGNTVGISNGAAMTAASIDFILKHPELSKKLESNIKRLKEGLKERGVFCNSNPSSIAAFEKGDSNCMKAIQSELINKGYYLSYAVYPGSGPEGVLRCTVSAAHTYEEIDKAAEAIAEVLNR